MLIRSARSVAAMTLGVAATGLALHPVAASTAPPPPGQCDTTTCTVGGTDPGHTEGGGSGTDDSGTIAADPCAEAPDPDLCEDGAINGPDADPVTVDAVVQRAVDSMARPAPRFKTSPAARTYVGIETYLWIDEGSWRTQTANPGPLAGMEVEATSVPKTVVWDLGEQVVRCTGPGVPYDAKAPRTPAGACTHVFKKSSAGQPGGTYKISVTIEWHVSWRCLAGCTDNGDFPDPIPGLSAVDELVVGEIQTGSNVG